MTSRPSEDELVARKPLLCRIGLHRWRVFNGRLLSTAFMRGGVVLYDQQCKRCGKLRRDRSFIA